MYLTNFIVIAIFRHFQSGLHMSEHILDQTESWKLIRLFVHLSHNSDLTMSPGLIIYILNKIIN